jgi:hypothetical protein
LTLGFPTLMQLTWTMASPMMPLQFSPVMHLSAHARQGSGQLFVHAVHAVSSTPCTSLYMTTAVQLQGFSPEQGEHGPWEVLKVGVRRQVGPVPQVAKQVHVDNGKPVTQWVWRTCPH